MARGKYKAAKARRDAQGRERLLASRREELAGEESLLASANADLAEVDVLRRELAVATVERDRAVAAESDRLRHDADVLADLVQKAEAARHTIAGLWERRSAEVAGMLGGGIEGFEGLGRLAGVPGILMDDVPSHARLGGNRVQHIQQARQQRHVVRETASNPDAVEERIIGDWLRYQWRQVYAEAGVDLDTLVAPAGLDPEMARRVTRADHLAKSVYRSRATETALDAVRCWHPLPWILQDAPARDGQPHPVPVLLGAAPDMGPPAPGPALRQVTPVDATLGAETRTALAPLGPDETEVAWNGPLRLSAAVTAATGRILEPWSRSPTYARPGDAVAVKHWYTAAAIGYWSRYADPENDTKDDGYCQVIGQVALGMAAATPFWLPHGQVLGYLDSEPMPAEDTADIRLPFPQVLMTFADPVLLDPIEQPDDDMRHMLNQLDTTVLFFVHNRRGEANTLADLLMHGPFDDDLWANPPSLTDLIAARGARVEGVLLLADSLGRLGDLFAWCLAVPAVTGDVLGRFTVPASRSKTTYTEQVTNLAAVAAWADWHPPDHQLNAPTEMTAQNVNRMVTSGEFRALERRGGAGGVRVLNVKRTSALAPAASRPGVA